MAFLTDRSFTTGVTLQDLIHIVNPIDLSQGNPAGSSYKATINQVFDAISGYCISDLYVTNVHGCSPITVWDDTYFLSNQIIQSNTPQTYTGFTSNLGGIFTFFDANRPIIHFSTNFNDGTDAFSGFVASGNTGSGVLAYVGTGYTRSIVTPTGVNFWRNKVQLRGTDNTDGMIINPNSANSNGVLWFEINGSATTKLKGNGLGTTVGLFGLGLNPDGTEDPTSVLQVGGTGTTASFKYVDGNQSNGYVLTSDSSGNATWQSSTSLQQYSTTAITSTQSITWDKQYWGISGTTDVDLTLPSTTSKDGYILIIKDEAGIAGSNRIRLIPITETIDGNPFVDMNINNMSLTIMARNNNWWII